MNDPDRLNQIRSETLKSMERNERIFKLSFGLCTVAEVVGLVAVVWLTDWNDPTHQLIFAGTMLVWINLALWVYTMAVRNRVGEQRILRAITVLSDSIDEANET